MLREREGWGDIYMRYYYVSTSRLLCVTKARLREREGEREAMLRLLRCETQRVGFRIR